MDIIIILGEWFVCFGQQEHANCSESQVDGSIDTELIVLYSQICIPVCFHQYSVHCLSYYVCMYVRMSSEKKVCIAGATYVYINSSKIVCIVL